MSGEWRARAATWEGIELRLAFRFQVMRRKVATAQRDGPRIANTVGRHTHPEQQTLLPPRSPAIPAPPAAAPALAAITFSRECTPLRSAAGDRSDRVPITLNLGCGGSYFFFTVRAKVRASIL
jgi:hypothetical protein